MTNINLEALSQSLTELSSMIVHDGEAMRVVRKIKDVCAKLTDLEKELTSSYEIESVISHFQEDSETVRYPQSMEVHDSRIRKALNFIRRKINEGSFTDAQLLRTLGFVPYSRHSLPDNAKMINNRIYKDNTHYDELSAKGRRNLENEIRAAYRRIQNTLQEQSTLQEYRERLDAYKSLLAFAVDLYNTDLPTRWQSEELSLSDFPLEFEEDA